MTGISPLSSRMVEDMTVRNLSPATQRSYLYTVARFSRFFGKSHERLDLEDVRTYQVYLASQGIAMDAAGRSLGSAATASTICSRPCGAGTASRTQRRGRWLNAGRSKA